MNQIKNSVEGVEVCLFKTIEKFEEIDMFQEGSFVSIKT
jgi:hypothetical protein